jgi:hypothetical protein
VTEKESRFLMTKFVIISNERVIPKLWRITLKLNVNKWGPVPVAARSKTRAFGRSPVQIVCSNPTGGMDVCSL